MLRADALHRIQPDAVQQLIEAGEVDLVVVSELREIYRNPAFLWTFVQRCVDNGVRFISIADCIDTADENWEIMMYAASMRHGMTVPEARRRVKRKATHSFRNGGMVLKIRFGYGKLTREEAASGTFGSVGLRIRKLSECTPIIREIRARILRDESYTAIADWLNDEGVDPGPYVEGGEWTGRVVKDLMRDLILSGRRRFRINLHRMVFKTGKSVQEPNPAGPEVKEYPELAHMTISEQTELLAFMDARKETSKAGQRKGKDSPLWRKPRNRSIWPGQHAHCSVCGGLMYCYGKVLRCRNSVPSAHAPAGITSMWTSTRFARR